MSSEKLTTLYVPHDSTDVYWNFGVESYFVEHLPEGCAAFLFWRTTPTLMLGKYQNVLSEINLDYARENRLNLVRRMSGGGTIYTDLGGWQYSFIQPQQDEEIEFRSFITPVVTALRRLGIPAEFSGRNDILVNGRKCSGNAQYKQKGVVVHHGSLLFDTDLEAIVKSTSVDDKKLISKGIASVRERVVNLRECLSPEMSAAMDSAAFGHYMSETLSHLRSADAGGAEIRVHQISAEERAEMARLGDLRYRREDALWGKNPAFSLEQSERFPGGRVTLAVNVEHGLITEAALSGDFFGTLEEGEFSRAVAGVPYKREAVLERLRESGIDGKLYLITAEEIAFLIRV